MTASRPRSRRAVRTLAAVALASVALAGCGGTTTAATAPPAAAAGPAVGAILIDVRTPDEFRTGHLEGARNLPVELAGFTDAVATLDPDAEYLVYCRSGRRADLAVEYMTGLGFSARNIGSVAEAAAETGVPVVR